MFQLFIKRIFIFLSLIAACYQSQAQSTVNMNIETSIISGHQSLIDVTVELKNSSESTFTGILKITTPHGFKNISGDKTIISLKPQEHIYIPLKMIKGKAAKAGTAEIIVELLNNEKQTVQKQIVKHEVEENNAMSLQAVTPTVFLTNINDSLSVKVQVSNLGNKPQQVFIVFSIPQLTSENGFFEKTATIDVQKDTIFDFKFWVTKALLEKTQFTVNVAAMRSSEKVLFGSTTVNIQNVTSVKRYENTQSTAYSQYHQKNTLTASYRTSGKNTNVYQLMGSGDIDLPAGYLSVNTNIYKADSQNEPLISNTYLAYKLDNHQVKIGNLSQPLEVPLFGRGIQLETANKNLNNRFQIGFIDENFNLTEQNAFLKRGYGLYALGTFGINNPLSQNSFNFIFKEDKIEAAKHHIMGVEKSHSFNNKWSTRIKAHAGFSYYERINKTQPSYSLETQYNGLINDLRLTGSYYFSSSYFPGNRRGVIQLQQSFVKNLTRQRSWFTNIFYSDFNPASYTYLMDMKTTNFRIDTGFTFPRIKFIGKTLGLQYFKESSNALSWVISDNFLAMESFRITNNINWLSSNQKHSVILGIEGGLVKMSNTKKLFPQFKINSIYSFKGFNATATYQHGSFFLSEHTSLLATNKKPNDFKRLTLSVATDHKFFSNKLFIRTGVAYLNDFISGKTPSGFLNANYFPTEKYRLYLNTSWFSYGNNTFAQHKSMYVVEAGISANLGSKSITAGRKGSLTAFAFYDKNSNNIFDENDEPAIDFFVTIDKTTFKTNSNGEIEYKNIPFGTYKLQAILQSGWFSDTKDCLINNYKNKLFIPLHQNGSVKGKIKYQYNDKIVKNFEPKIEGIVFTITKNGNFVQRIATNDEGNFVAFLPTGIYEIAITPQSLPENTFCEQPKQIIKILSGKLTNTPDFIIQVQQKQIKVKKFGE